MNRHQVSGWGHDWTLMPHAEPFADSNLQRESGWFADGMTSDGEQCEAVSEAKSDRCPKPSVVVIAVEVPNGHGDNTDGVYVRICGGHYGVHRRGKPLKLAVALQYWVPA